MPELTAREDEVRRLAVEGLSNDEIAVHLDISRRTVEAHLRTLFRKTGVTRRSQLAGLAAAAAGESATAVAVAERLAEYEELVRTLVDRHLTLFAERVEITLAVGDDHDSDAVVERRWTTPTPYVVHRMLRPIVPYGATGLSAHELALSCAVHGLDVQADVLTLTESDGLPLAIVLFRPGLSEPVDWILRYRAEGLWDELRDTGADTLFWDTATTRGRGGHHPTVTEVAFRLEFPPGWTGVGLAETSGAGTVTETVRSSGQQVLEWRDDDPTASGYRWRLTGSRPS
jgi:DNA-binding CsgD family transcriptional regulator